MKLATNTGGNKITDFYFALFFLIQFFYARVCEEYSDWNKNICSNQFKFGSYVWIFLKNNDQIQFISKKLA